MNKRIQYIDTASEFMSKDEIDYLIGKYGTLLEEKGISRNSSCQIETSDHLIYFILSGGVEGKTYKLIRNRLDKFPCEPVILIAHPEDNSLPAALELLAKLRQEDHPGKVFLLNSANDLNTIDQVIEYLSQNIVKPLTGIKIGMVGEPSDWLIASSPDKKEVTGTWGAQVQLIDTKVLFDKITRIDDRSITELVSDFKVNSIAVIEPTDPDLMESVKVYSALKEIVKEYDLDALSLRCFDLVTDLNTTGCYALAKLNEEGIPASCEGDIVSLLAMLWVKQTTGKTAWMANPAEIDINNNEILLAHCTIAFDLIDEYRIRTHFESGIGIGIQGKLPLTPVTMVRLGGKDLNRMWIMEGSITAIPESEKLCRTQVRISVEEKEKLVDLMQDPLGNHLTLIQGHHKTSLIENWNSYFRLT